MKYAILFNDSKKESKKIIKHEIKDEIRINKYLSEQGLLSRRKADEYIKANRIKINNKIAVLGMIVKPNDKVYIDNQEILEKTNNNVYIALNKPKGIISTSNLNIKNNLSTFMNYHERIFMIGRLDKDTSGLILLTNDGNIVNKILRANYEHEKEYIVTVNKPINNAFLKELEDGVVIYNPVRKRHQKTSKSQVYKINEYSFGLIITQGLNRQIRRMVSALNYEVVDLKRIRVMNIKLDNLPLGNYRYLTKDELMELNNLIHLKSD